MIRPSGLVGRVEYRVGQPAVEAGIVAELFEQLGVILQQVRHDALERIAMIRLGALPVISGLCVLVHLGYTRGDFFGDDMADTVAIFPVDVSEQFVERLDCVRGFVKPTTRLSYPPAPANGRAEAWGFAHR